MWSPLQKQRFGSLYARPRLGRSSQKSSWAVEPGRLDRPQRTEVAAAWWPDRSGTSGARPEAQPLFLCTMSGRLAAAWSEFPGVRAKANSRRNVGPVRRDVGCLLLDP